MKKINFRFIFSRLFDYALSLAAAVIFALFLSGRIGWFLVITIISAPILSVLTAYVCSKKINVGANVGYVSLCKGDSCNVTVNVVNDFFLPTPTVLIEMADHPAVKCIEKCYSVSVMPYSTEEISAGYTAKICGPSQIGIKAARVSDYFGIVSFPLKSIDNTSIVHTVAVIPDAAEINENDVVIRKASILSAQADDSEETIESSFLAFGGFPGYDTREYVPGDPLKRVNWKQSVRRNRLMVRADEETACSEISVILDSVFRTESVNLNACCQELLCSEEECISLIAQAAVENALGYALKLMDGLFKVNFFMNRDGEWEVYKLNDENDITLLKTELAFYRFADTDVRSRFPNEEMAAAKGSVSVFCTPFSDNELEIALSHSGYSEGTDEKIIVFTAVGSYGAADRSRGESNDIAE